VIWVSTNGFKRMSAACVKRVGTLVHISAVDRGSYLIRNQTKVLGGFLEHTPHC
jgi:hypothetical protein